MAHNLMWSFTVQRRTPRKIPDKNLFEIPGELCSTGMAHGILTIVSVLTFVLFSSLYRDLGGDL